MASSQTLLLGREQGRVAQALQRLTEQQAVARCWEKDASLWTGDPVQQEAIRNRLGWLTVPRLMPCEVPSLTRFAQELRSEGFTHALVLGMGGSGLFSEVCRKTFGVAAGGLELTVLDTTDPTAIRSAQASCPLKQLVAIVSSKSGTTSEVAALSTYFYETFKTDGDPGRHCIAITDAGTPLEAQAKAGRYRRVFVHGPQNGADVGGRFSALTYFGLVPAALLGVALNPLLASAMDMLDCCGPSVAPPDNPAAQLAAVLGALGQAGKDKVTLLTVPALESFGAWIEQLIAESTGKSGKGLVPIVGEPVRQPSGYAGDRLFIELQLGSEPDAALERRVTALSEAGHPVVRIRWQDRDELGGEVIRWALATSLTGWLMDVNPFDEPNVQESKDRTKALLAQYAEASRLPFESPSFTEGGVTLFGDLPSGATQSLGRALALFLEQRRSNDYVALLSFLPRTGVLDRALQVLRSRLSDALGLSTMLGVGPRYLHSTGQLYKGGPDGGLFFLLTADEREDVAIPSEPLTFGVLKQAQALGDFQAMRSRKRRILRLHLGRDPQTSIHTLLSTVEEAAASVVRR